MTAVKMLAGIASTLVILELMLRLFGYGSYLIFQPDDRLLWVPIPEQKGITVEGHLPITINEDGFRYGMKISEKKEGEIRIFSFGDSLTMGWGVDDRSHYSAYLEGLLNEEPLLDHHVRVVSAGVNAHPNSLVLERFRKVVEDGFRPDIAVVAFSFNTNHEGLVALSGEERKEFLQKVALKGIVRRFALYNFFVEDLLRNWVYYRLRDRLVQGSWDVQSTSADEGATLYKEQLKEMRKFSDLHGVTPILLLLGSMNQTLDDLHPFQATMLEFAKESKTGCVNMVEVLDSKNHDLFFLDHAHLNSKGHELIAQELAKIIGKILGDTGAWHSVHN